MRLMQYCSRCRFPIDLGAALTGYKINVNDAARNMIIMITRV